MEPRARHRWPALLGLVILGAIGVLTLALAALIGVFLLHGGDTHGNNGAVDPWTTGNNPYWLVLGVNLPGVLGGLCVWGVVALARSLRR
ncbi:hypothetical protein [Galactobacter valiniphilus]|uniref:hypothetical protein n=1 Tax=Galactobacter valiniphilus TaxID=2676122 RepID=UPI001313FB93|nr:hypothetical protein [Galactobacter valiniphilus]